MREREPNGFEGRVGLGAWRWLILSALGVAPYACGGRAGTVALEGPGAALSNGGAGGTSSTHFGTGGAAGSAAAGAAGSVSVPVAMQPVATQPPTTQPSACVFDAALDGGMQRCTNGMLHRSSLGVCPQPPPRPDPVGDEYATLADAGVMLACLRDSDCTELPYGRCAQGQGGPYCWYGCAGDTDCAADQLCSCNALGGSCVPATCRTDASCGAGSLCASNQGCYQTSFSCQRPGDECAVASDCQAGQRCTFQGLDDNPLGDPAPGPVRVCAVVACPVIGRPFLVHGVERVAPATERQDWCALDPGVPVLAASAALRAELADRWTQQALMEHASVAAFARFSLQLLGLGAPAELVAAAATAMQDEIRHAQDCFRLARRHAERDVGPGVLPLADALEQGELNAIVLGTVIEGCIGETVAAVEAAEALERCEDPAVRAVLQRISLEETRHAELAWRFVAWALETRTTSEAADLREQLRRVFADAIAVAPIAPPGTALSTQDRELQRHGLLSEPLRQALRGRVLREVVSPCAAALLAAPGCTRSDTPLPGPDPDSSRPEA